MELRTVDVVPNTEYSVEFLQGMVDRMGMSFFKYGAIALAYPNRVDAMKSLQLRLEKYEKTGNREHLIDAANYLMIEFMRPRHPDAHFHAEDSKASPGRVWDGEVDPSQRTNLVERVHE